MAEAGYLCYCDRGPPYQRHPVTCQRCQQPGCGTCCPPYRAHPGWQTAWSICPPCLHAVMGQATHCLCCSAPLGTGRGHLAICTSCQPQCPGQTCLHVQIFPPQQSGTPQRFTLLEPGGYTILELLSRGRIFPQDIFYGGYPCAAPVNILVWHHQLTVTIRETRETLPLQLSPRAWRRPFPFAIPGQLADLHHPGIAILRMNSSRRIHSGRCMAEGETPHTTLGFHLVAIVGRNGTVYTNATTVAIEQLLPRIAPGSRLFLTHGLHLFHPTVTISQGGLAPQAILFLIQLQADQAPPEIWKLTDSWPSFPREQLYRSGLPENVIAWRRCCTPDPNSP